jgi:hypothetical protein
MRTQDGRAGGSGVTPGYGRRLYFSQAVLTQSIIDFQAVAMLGYEIQVREEAKIIQPR